MKTHLLLTRPHTHAGRLRRPGERIEVDADLARWLVSIGSAHALPPTRSGTPPHRVAQIQPKEPNP
ncbi:hypothetical protein JI739_19720 [Ramlibacter sp. AW1]|uniref:DUF7210 domain-containing protein n=1 Tax=Ramlibacter aurantiacus TaxID=2801330 RepID=A0A936ZSD3_9BURK|nr:hypothetical protein [Ramlibacter aurantiacus]MBL0422583.1 hypothetical protein [Ramlibacter aurantiacus]